MGFRTPYIHTDKHTHMRACVLADHRDVGLLRNTGIDPLPPLHPRQFKKLSNIAFSCPPAKKQQSGSAYAIILTVQFLNGCSLFFLNKRVVQEIIC